MAVAHAKGRKSRMAAKEAKPTRHNRPTSPMLKLAMAISHPVRFRIISAMNAPERNASPKELAEEFDLDVKRVAYHVRELADLGYLELVDTEPRHGSIEHVYRPVQRFEAWSLEWNELFPAFKQIVAASALGIGVAAVGASIDAGRFEARDDSVVAHIQSRCNEVESGGRVIDSVLTNTLLPRIGKELLLRMLDGASVKRVSVTAAGGDFVYAYD